MLANISQFEALQNSANQRMGSPMAVFNANIEEIQASIESWMTQIDGLRSLDANAEADSEEKKLESLLDETNSRLSAGVRATRRTISDLKGANIGQEPETPPAEPSMSEPSAELSAESTFMSPTAGAPAAANDALPEEEEDETLV